MVRIITTEIDLSLLSEEARKELIDFFEFLLQKYSVQTLQQQTQFKKFLSTPIKVEKVQVFSRDELHER